MRNDEIAAQFQELKTSIRTIADESHQAKLDRIEMMQKVDKTAEKVDKMSDIVAAWDAVKTSGKFLKWFGGIMAAIGAIIVATKTAVISLTGK